MESSEKNIYKNLTIEGETYKTLFTDSLKKKEMDKEKP